jgi:hypothetical protein
MHQMVGKVLRTYLNREPPQDMASAKENIDEALSITMHAMRAAILSTLGKSHGSITFNRDMFLNIPLIADWHTITQRQEHLINENFIRENQKLSQERVLKKKGNLASWGKESVDHTEFYRHM